MGPFPDPETQQQHYPPYAGYHNDTSYIEYPNHTRFPVPPPQYYGYPPQIPHTPYPYRPQAPRPKRDGYQLTIAVISFIGAMLTLLGGLICTLFVILSPIVIAQGRTSISANQQFSAIVTLTVLAIAGLLGGGFSLYHSMRVLFFQKPSADFKLPWFWIFLIFYIGVIAIGAVLSANGQAVTNIPLTTFLIVLASVLPALTILSLGVRRLHVPRTANWPTSWRRFTLAIVSSATLAIVLASVFELILTSAITRGMGAQNFSLDNPNQPTPHDPRMIGLLFILVSVIAPLVEEAVKPLAVVIMIGRMRGAVEVFVLGLACGIGFDLIETASYISIGYGDWLNVALERSTAGLLHGLGAGMVALGWYYLTHPKESKHRFLLAFGCWTYAVLQHAIWNGSFGLQLLPAPIGPYLDTGTIPLGSISVPSFIVVYIVESLLMLIFFLYVTGKLRATRPLSASQDKPSNVIEVGTGVSRPSTTTG